MRTRIESDAAMRAWGQRLAQGLRPADIVYLQGPLGAGKTTLVQGIMLGLGYSDIVRSPTYTVIEVYDHTQPKVAHLDLYRLRDSEEWVWRGIGDYVGHSEYVSLIEWPERLAEALPKADLYLSIQVQGSAREINCASGTSRGEALLQGLSEI